MTKYLFDRLRQLSNRKLSQAQVNALDSLIAKGCERDLAQILEVTKPMSIQITAKQLKNIYAGANLAFVPFINTYAEQFGITTKNQMAAFLANVIHESAGFNRLRESLDYKPARLLAVFPNRITNLAHAVRLVDGGQVAIGDAVYGGRYGNGIKNGDGYRYRGGGLMHTTFKDNYRETGRRIDVDLVNFPDQITQPEIAVRAAMDFWQNKKCGVAADRGDIETVRLIINGGRNGFNEVKALYNKALNELN